MKEKTWQYWYSHAITQLFRRFLATGSFFASLGGEADALLICTITVFGCRAVVGLVASWRNSSLSAAIARECTEYSHHVRICWMPLMCWIFTSGWRHAFKSISRHCEVCARCHGDIVVEPTAVFVVIRVLSSVPAGQAMIKSPSRKHEIKFGIALTTWADYIKSYRFDFYMGWCRQ